MRSHGLCSVPTLRRTAGIASPRSLIVQALAAILILTCVFGTPIAGAGSVKVQLLVKFRATATADQRAGVLAAAGGRQTGAIKDLGVKVVSVPAAAKDTALRAFGSSPLVSFAETDGTLKPQDNLPSDPSFPQQFAVGGGAWGWYKTHTTQAWDLTKGDPSIVIAILDTGLQTGGLDDFSGQLVPGWNVMNNTSDTSSNAGNHGTYVAGVAGLALDNAVGSAGFCPSCKIMPVQVGTDTGASDSAIASGITWAADHGARVENLSWAGSSSSSTIASAVSYARSKGVVVVAAAGNSNCDCTQYPAATPGVLGVAGTDTTDNKQGDSNYGSWVKLAAPEGNMTAWPTINGAPGYSPVGGTSLAAPVVAGIAGLLFSANPSLSGAQVEQALEQSAVPVNFSVAYGRVDALAALQWLGFSDPQASSVPVNGKTPQIMVETNGDWNYTPLGTNALQPGQVLLRGQGSWTGSAPLSLSAVKWLRCDPSGANCTTAATTTRYIIQSTDPGSTFKLSVTVKNGLGSTTATSALSQPVGGSAPPPPPPPPPSSPANTAPPAVSGIAQSGQTLSATTGSWSGSPTSYSFQWQRCDSTGAGCSPVSGATGENYPLTDADVSSTMEVVVTATNSAGSASASSAATAVVAAAPAPPPPPPSTQTLTFSGSLSPKNPLRTFSVTVGAGAVDARLSFSKCSTLSLALQSTAASPLATRTAPSVNVLDSTLPAGNYSYAVSGGRCSFTLTVTSPSP